MLAAERNPTGIGIRDGRGYGPYGMGYRRFGTQVLPYGPTGELLTEEYDFQPNPSGGYLPARLPPQMLDDSVTSHLPVPLRALAYVKEHPVVGVLAGIGSVLLIGAAGFGASRLIWPATSNGRK